MTNQQKRIKKLLKQHYLIFNRVTLSGFWEYIDQFGNYFTFDMEEQEVSAYVGDEMFLEYEKIPSELIKVEDENFKEIKFNGKYKFL